MGLEDAAEARVPFISEEVNLLSTDVVFLVVSLIAGMTIWNMSDSIGENLAARVNSFIGNMIGTNPATGQTTDSGGAFD